jgi:effector-binding domain-containing protein
MKPGEIMFTRTPFGATSQNLEAAGFGCSSSHIVDEDVDPTPLLLNAPDDRLDSRNRAYIRGAFGELSATLSAQGLRRAGPAGGIYSNAIFTHGRGEATVFLPCESAVRPVGRVVPLVVPEMELATIEHFGPPTNIDIAYGALATYVSQHALAVDGPLREYYLIGQLETLDTSAWRTEIGWPVFQTRQGA